MNYNVPDAVHNKSTAVATTMTNTMYASTTMAATGNAITTASIIPAKTTTINTARTGVTMNNPSTAVTTSPMATLLGARMSLKLAQAVGFNKYQHRDSNSSSFGDGGSDGDVIGGSSNTSATTALSLLPSPMIPLNEEELKIQERMLSTGVYPSSHGDLTLKMLLSNRDVDSKEWRRNIEFVSELSRSEKEHICNYMFDMLNIR